MQFHSIAEVEKKKLQIFDVEINTPKKLKKSHDKVETKTILTYYIILSLKKQQYQSSKRDRTNFNQAKFCREWKKLVPRDTNLTLYLKSLCVCVSRTI